MQVIRVISYESDDPERMAKQLASSLSDGRYPKWQTDITVATVPESNQELISKLREFLAPYSGVFPPEP